jgi:hypothetical protein
MVIGNHDCGCLTGVSWRGMPIPRCWKVGLFSVMIWVMVTHAW